MPTGNKDTSSTGSNTAAVKEQSAAVPKEGSEWGGPKGLEPTRYGDWERNGRCIDF